MLLPKVFLYYKVFITLLILSLFKSSAMTQPDINWERSFGGSESEWPNRIEQCPDGNFIIIGQSESVDGDIIQNNGSLDGFVVKVDKDGNKIWSKNFGGSGFDTFYDMEVDRDGNCLLFGSTRSFDLSIQSLGGYDFWLVKIDPSGNMLWEKVFGGSNQDIGYDLDLTDDGGYILYGETNSQIANVTNFINSPVVYIAKLDQDANLEWEQSYGGAKNERGFDIKQLSNGGYIAVGRSKSINGDVTSTELIDKYWVIRLDAAGELVWDKTIPTNEETWDIVIESADANSVIISGTTEDENIFVTKMSSNGDVIWNKNFGGNDSDRVFCILKTSDNGFVIGGSSSSNDGDLTNNNGATDSWIIKLDDAGNLIWQKSMGGSMNDVATDIVEISLDCFIVSNGSFSNDFDVSQNKGESDMWIVKLCREDCTDDDEFVVELETYEALCESNTVEIFVSSNYEIDSFEWEGPSNEGNNGENIIVSLAGEYTLIAHTDICSDTASIIIETSSLTENDFYTICEGESIVINNDIFSEEGFYQQFLTSTNGCDTTVNIELNVLKASNEYLEMSVCAGTEYLGYSETGDYIDTLINLVGCDSIRYLNLQVLDEINTNFEMQICEGDSYEGYITEGTYIDTLESIGGCDSIRILDLRFQAEVFVEMDVSLCPGEVYEFNNNLISEEGSYNEVIESESGCDSVMILNLSYFETASFLQEDVSLCGVDEFTIQSSHENTIWFDQSIGPNILVSEEGFYTAEATDENGCSVSDSLHVDFGLKYFMPNVFSPDNDGVNDNYMPLLPNDFSWDEITTFEFIIFNRWGNKVYHSTDYLQALSIGWDGKFNGLDPNPDIYVYYINIETEFCNSERTGDVLIVR